MSGCRGENDVADLSRGSRPGERRPAGETLCLDRWSEAARQVIVAARFEAGGAGAETIDTEHLLLGLVRLTPELIREVGAGMTIETVRADSRRWQTASPPVPTTKDMPVSGDVRLVFEGVETMPPAGRCKFFRTEHLLLALAGIKTSHAAMLLMEAGASIEAMRLAAERADCNEQEPGHQERLMSLLEGEPE